jgi:hypothetical protein
MKNIKVNTFMAKKLLIDLDKLRDNRPGESSDDLRPGGRAE